MGKFRYPVVLFIASMIFLFIGLLFKIQHWPGGSFIPGSMLMVQAVAIVWLIILLLRKDKKL